jgi:3-dehydroquinate dehydratase / shikimate dehydrogenase
LLFSDRICAVVAASTASETAAALRDASKQSATIELRLDWLKSPQELERFLEKLGRTRKSFPAKTCLIATLRRRGAGGRFAGSVAEELGGLLKAVRAGCSWCDLEVESAGRLESDAIRDLRQAGARVMTSFHDFRATPADLRPVLRRLDRCGGDAIKIATLARSARDAERLLATIGRRRDMVVVPMGEVGLPGRVLALRAGSALAYASVMDATAPGQLSVAQMRDQYRADRLDHRTSIYGVIGDPIAHSLSPVMHNAAFAARRVNAILLPFRVNDVRDFLAVAKSLRMAGFAVTLPHKQEIIRHLAGCDPLAKRIGAVNTVVARGKGKLYGYNTDYVGVLRALENRVRLAGSRVLLLGAGGAARAAAFALAEAGAIVCVWARRESRAKALARTAGGQSILRSQLKHEFFDAVINATPLGLHPKDASPIHADELNCRVAMDMIYKPLLPPFLRVARSKGIETVSGAEMFLAQGAAQWEIWMGQRAPMEPMKRVILAALKPK